MRFLLKCSNDPKHKTFCAMAHVTQEWLCNKEGEFIDVTEGNDTVDIVHEPNANDSWTCAECGARAEIEWRDDLNVSERPDASFGIDCTTDVEDEE